MCWLLSFLLLVSTIKHSGVLLHTLHYKLHYSFQNNIVPGPNSQWKLVSKSPYRLMEFDQSLYMKQFVWSKANIIKFIVSQAIFLAQTMRTCAI